MKRLLWPGPWLTLALFIGGCGASSTPQNYAYQRSKAHIANCAHAGKAIALPASFPKAFPFPPGTNIDSTKPLVLKGQIGIFGFVPSSSFASTVNFFKDQVPKRGFKLLYFEVDSPNDSEGTYRGHGKVGKWQLRAIPSCPRAMTFAVSALKA